MVFTRQIGKVCFHGKAVWIIKEEVIPSLTHEDDEHVKMHSMHDCVLTPVRSVIDLHLITVELKEWSNLLFFLELNQIYTMLFVK